MNCLIIMAKSPIDKPVKTRLAKDLGEKEAKQVYKDLTTKVVKSHMFKLYRLLVYVDGDPKFFHDIGCMVKKQGPGDLGKKMNAILEKEMPSFNKILIMGSDVPLIEPSQINKIFSHLDKNDVVLGPAKDGGYYLIGMKEHHDLFKIKKWSTDSVCKETLDLIKKKNLKCKMLDEMRDVDTIEDYEYYKNKGVL